MLTLSRSLREALSHQRESMPADVMESIVRLLLWPITPHMATKSIAVLLDGMKRGAMPALAGWPNVTMSSTLASLVEAENPWFAMPQDLGALPIGTTAGAMGLVLMMRTEAHIFDMPASAEDFSDFSRDIAVRQILKWAEMYRR